MNIILDRIAKGEHISISRYNDGELGAILGHLTKTSRQQQPVTPDLVQKLNYGLDYRADGYFIGIPCPACFPVYYNYIRKRLDGYDNQILAVSTTNNHYKLFKTELLKLLRDKDVAVLADRRFTLPLNYAKFYLYDGNNDAKNTEKVLLEIGKHEYYILTLGAASRYLAAKMHEKGMNALDLGSIFEPEKCGKMIRAHVWPSKYRNEQDYCPICNY